jgi:regulator of cell morphogenesis and NO signaling
MIQPSTTLAELALAHAGAQRVFLRHQLDFCCGGQRSLAEACRAAGLSPEAIAAEIAAAGAVEPPSPTWAADDLDALIDHIVERYHRTLRADLPALITAAQRVEKVHAAKPSCPRGLAFHLERMATELLAHMDREERVLFPAIRAGDPRVETPIDVLRREHDSHARALTVTRELTADLVAPPEACATWRALYAGLVTLEGELMRHVLLENHVLFPHAVDRRGRPSGERPTS